MHIKNLGDIFKDDFGLTNPPKSKHFKDVINFFNMHCEMYYEYTQLMCVINFEHTMQQKQKHCKRDSFSMRVHFSS